MQLQTKRKHIDKVLFGNLCNDHALENPPSKTVKLSKKEIEVAFKKNKTSPRVPVHKMDTMYKNVTKSMIKEVD